MRIAPLACLALLSGFGAASAQTLQPASPAMAPSSSSDVQLRTVGDLLSLCDASSDGIDMQAGFPQKQTMCAGYGEGVLDSYLTITAPQPSQRRVCLPNPAPKRATMISQFVTWVKANPGTEQRPAAPGVLEFLMATYPCRGNG